MNLLWLRHQCNLRRRTALNGNDSKHQRKHLGSFITVDSGHHNDQISDFKTDHSHWGSGHYILQSGLGE